MSRDPTDRIFMSALSFLSTSTAPLYCLWRRSRQFRVSRITILVKLFTHITGLIKQLNSRINIMAVLYGTGHKLVFGRLSLTRSPTYTTATPVTYRPLVLSASIPYIVSELETKVDVLCYDIECWYQRNCL